jgi:hypothetical protein
MFDSIGSSESHFLKTYHSLLVELNLEFNIELENEEMREREWQEDLFWEWMAWQT